MEFFSCVAAKLIKKILKRNFQDHWRQVLEQNTLSGLKIWKFEPIGRTWSDDPMFWSHIGQKDRIEIFGHRASKMINKSWKETFGTTGVKLRNEIPSPGETFGNLTLVAPQNDLPQVPFTRRSKRPKRNFRPWGGQNAKKILKVNFHRCKVPERNTGKIWKIDPVGRTWKCILGSGRTLVKKNELKFLDVGLPNG